MASSSSQHPIAASSSSQHPIAASSSSKPINDLTRYLPLHKAILKGNLESVKQICNLDEHALEARITVNLDTALHVAVGTGMANHIVGYLLNKMSTDQVVLKNRDGYTVLSVAAIAGNMEAAKLLVKKDESLSGVKNNCGWIPLILAAQHKRKLMIDYLLRYSGNFFTPDGIFSTETLCVFFMNLVIGAEFYDLALKLLHDCPNLATMMSSDGDSLLKALAGKPSSFSSRRTSEFRLPEFSLHQLFLKCIKGQGTILNYYRELQLVRVLCEEITRNLDHKGASILLKQPFLLAAELGVCEIVKEIITAFPDAIWFSNEMNRNAFQLAIMNRHVEISNLVFQTRTADISLLLMSKDICGNNILHLVGKLAPQSKLNLIPGAVMQMQRELQWFKAVKNIVHPRFIDDKNCEGKTPAMVFSEEHKELVKEGENWMKSAASSSSVAGALIATIVFAAAIAVPGDYADDGTPNFHKQKAFTLFAISDTISMFSSFAAIIMFLSIFTSRYAEEDFFQALPNKLALCLALSFMSLTWTMIAFACAAYLVFFGQHSFGLIFLAGSLYLPISLFILAQYPLLIYFLVSTNSPGIFRKENKHVVSTK